MAHHEKRQGTLARTGEHLEMGGTFTAGHLHG